MKEPSLWDLLLEHYDPELGHINHKVWRDIVSNDVYSTHIVAALMKAWEPALEAAENQGYVFNYYDLIRNYNIEGRHWFDTDSPVGRFMPEYLRERNQEKIFNALIP